MAKSSREELEYLHSLYFREVYWYCRYRLYCQHQAEDAASEVFLKLAQQYPKLKARTYAWIRRWLFSTARNVARAFKRDQRRQEAIQEGLARDARRLVHNDDNQEWMRSDLSLDWPVVYQAIAKLKVRHQELLFLRYTQDLQSPEIADLLGMKPSTVRVQLGRALAALQERLRGKLDA